MCSQQEQSLAHDDPGVTVASSQIANMILDPRYPSPFGIFCYWEFLQCSAGLKGLVRAINLFTTDLKAMNPEVVALGDGARAFNILPSGKR